MTAPTGPQSLASSPALAPWDWWREQMPISKKWAYFDHAAVGPLTKPAADALRKYAAEAEFEGDTVWPTWAAAGERLRKGFAELLNTSAENVCFVPNTSTGISIVAEGFPWNPGDNVIVPEGEFPSNLFPWQNQSHRGVEVRLVPRRGIRVEIDDLMERVDERTRMIAVSWVGYASGFRIDLEQLVSRAHERGVLVFLDAIQGLGVYDLDLSKIDVDFLAADGHKWLLGPEGMGMAMVQKRHLDTLRVSNVGWGSVRDTFNYSEPKLEWKSTAARFEPGSPNMAGAAALGASLELMLQVRRKQGPTAIGARVIENAVQLVQKLASIGVDVDYPEESMHRTGIVTFSVPWASPATVRQTALQSGCVVSCRGGGVRASVHAYNSHADLDQLVEAVLQSKNADPNERHEP